MTKLNRVKMVYETLFIVLIILRTGIFAQDNTNNKMVEKPVNDYDAHDMMIKKNANYYSNELVSKLDLTRSQAMYIYNLLCGYYSNGTADPTSEIAALKEKPKSPNLEQDPLMKSEGNIRVYNDYPLSKIESVLDLDQKDKWLMVKDAWWLNAKSVLPDNNQNINEGNSSYIKNKEYEDDRDYENFDVYYPGYDIKK